VTERGMKHLGELASMVKAGHRAAMLFLAQRADGMTLRLARDIDPAYGEAFDAARAAGVEMLCYACRVTQREIAVERAVPIGEPVPATRIERARRRKVRVLPDPE
jgi:sugar fermentation stimulation protein A